MFDSAVVGISPVDFVAMVAAAGTVYFATRVDAATSIVVEILFDLTQTLVTNHSHLVNGFQELENCTTFHYIINFFYRKTKKNTAYIGRMNDYYCHA